MKRNGCTGLSLCGALAVVTSTAMAQEAAGPQPSAIDVAIPGDSAQAAGSFYVGIAGGTANAEPDVLMIEAGRRPTVELYDGQSRQLGFSAEVKRVSVDDPQVVEFDAVGDRELRIIGRRQGITQIRVTIDPGQVVIVDVIVTQNVSELTMLLKRLYPEASIEVIPARESMILRGMVSESEHLQQINEIARQFTPTVLDQLKIAGTLTAGTIPAGYRVVSVPIAEAQTLTGMLRAGDRVDVLVTFQRRDATGVMQSRTLTLLENAEVFAPDSRPGDRERMALVSLLVRPEEVNAIKLAQSRGNLSLAWRQPQQEAASRLNASALQEVEGSAGTRPVPNDSTVQKPGEDAAVPPAGDLQQIRDELRSLHDDVRRLIKILERRNKDEPAATSQVTPVPATTNQAKDKLVGLFFMADWCGPCQKMAPIVGRMREQHGCNIRTINVDMEPGLSEIFSIDSLPTIIVLDDGREVDRVIGVTSEDRLERGFLSDAGASSAPNVTSTGDLAWEVLGIRLSMEPRNDVGSGTPFQGDLKVTEIHPDGPAARGSICQGDILVGLHVWETATLDNVNFVLGHSDLLKFMPLKFYVMRKGELFSGYLSLDPLPDSYRSQAPRGQQPKEPSGIRATRAKELYHPI